MRSGRTSRPAEIITALGSLLALAAVIGGLPAGLYLVAGSPLPHSLPAFHQVLTALTHRDTGALFLAALRDVTWAAWACFTLTTFIETVCQARGRTAPRLAGLGGMQHATRTLIAAVVVGFSASGPAVPAVMVPAATAVAAASTTPAASPAVTAVLDAATFPAHSPSVTVAPGGNLWDIAQHHLGDGERWHEIFQLNHGRQMPGGATFTDPSVVVPGFVLHMPADPGQHPAGHGAAHQARHGAHPQHAARSGPGVPQPASPSAAAPAAAASPDATPAASVTALSPAGQHSPEVPPLAAAFLLGMGTTGVLMAVSRMRHRQRQARGRGRRIALPVTPGARRTERDLRAATPPPLPSVLRRVLAGLADGLVGTGQPLPGIAGVHLTQTAAEVLLTEAAAMPPAPFTVRPGTKDMCWTVPAGSWDHLPPVSGTGRGDLLPGLVTAGLTGEGGYLLVDLEAMGVTTVDGPAGLADQVVTLAGIELATNPWAGTFDLVLAGYPAAELEGAGTRAQACGSLDEAISVLAGRARELASLPAGPAARDRRLADPACPDWTLTLLVSRIVPDEDQMGRLLDAAAPGSGVAALIAGDITDGAGREAPASLDLRPSPGRPGIVEASLHPLGVVLTAHIPDADAQEALLEILGAATAPDVSPGEAPYDTGGMPAWTVGAAVPGDGPAPVPSSAGGRPADRDPGSGSHDGTLRITILGPFTISGAGADLQPKHAELVLALALAGPAGLSNSALRTMLGPDEDHPKSSDSLRQAITRTRRELGTTADGGEHIMHVGNSQYVLQSAWLDWEAFRTLAQTGREQRDTAALWDALSLVRGRPLDGVWHWWVEPALIEAIRAEIVDAADVLAELELQRGDAAGARRAARTGLSADRSAEPLWRAVMLAEDAAGNTAGVHQAWQECLAAIGDIAADGEPHPDTADLYGQLTRRPAAHAAS
jgi:DNA-binding SARP family transcriptional activator